MAALNICSDFFFFNEVILKPKKVKSGTDSIVSPSIYHEVMGLDAMILFYLNFEF